MGKYFIDIVHLQRIKKNVYFSTPAITDEDVVDILNFYPFYVYQGNYENDDLMQKCFIRFMKLMADKLSNGRYTNELFKVIK